MSQYASVSRDSGVGVDVEPTGDDVEARARRAIAKSKEQRERGSPTARVGEREDAPLLSGGRLGPSSDGGQEVQDKTETIDWVTQPDPAKADAFKKCLMANCTHNTAPALTDPTKRPTSGQLASFAKDGHIRETLDVAAGYDHVAPESIHQYPLWSTTVEELGIIGGQGVRVYFELLERLPKLFFVIAVLNTPSLYFNLFAEENMYDTGGMTKQYQSLSARSTLGSVYADPDVLSKGADTAMFVRTILDGVSILVLLVFVLSWSKTQSAIAAVSSQARPRLLVW